MNTSAPQKHHDVVLSVRGASQVFRMGEVEVTALRDASIDLFEGEMLVIIGPSGSGKSTLLNLLGGMNRPTTGTVMLGDLDLSRASDRELTRVRRDHVGIVFQFYNLVPSLTALENVQVATEAAADAMDPMEALRLVELADRADHFPSQMSGGEQQRVSIARAIAKKPRILLCDEPTGALDIKTGQKVLQLLSDLKKKRGQTVALITHNSSIAHIADRVARLRDGVITSVEVNEHPLDPSEVTW